MRVLAIIANFGLLGFTAYEFLSHGLPTTGSDWGIFAFLVIAPIFSLVALFTTQESKSWLALFLKRKALEEQKKIDELKTHNDA
jgi:hypothetical protein